MKKLYNKKLLEQIGQYKNQDNIHVFSSIHSYWTKKYLKPRLKEVMMAENHIEVYVNAFRNRLKSDDKKHDLLSIGCGNGEVEIKVIKRLVDSGIDNFAVDCLDLSSYQLERLQNEAFNSGISNFVNPIQTDINYWKAPRKYIGVMAHHSLHHFTQIENLLDMVLNSLNEKGVFVSFDMIGRNGHMRWPEVLEIVEKLWNFLPMKKKYNFSFKRYDKKFINWDCSTEGFEGIRSQDILSYLVKRFNFESFLGYGNLTDPFIGRTYGPNFDSKYPEDCALIDLLELLNEILIDIGHIKPTKMAAVMTTRETQSKFYKNWSPKFCIREVELSASRS